MVSMLYRKIVTRAIRVESQQLPSFWAEEQDPLANSGPSYPKLGLLNLALADDMAVRLP